MKIEDAVACDKAGFPIDWSQRLSGWLIVIALVWLSAPSFMSLYERDNPSSPEQVFTALQELDLGVGQAGWITLRRQGVGEYHAMEWERWQFHLHPRALTAVPLLLLSLALLMRQPAVAVRMNPVLLAAVSLIKQQSRRISEPLTLGLAAGFGVALLALLVLPAQHVTILERADAEQLGQRLESQLVGSDIRHDLRLVMADGEVPQLHVIIYRHGLLSIDVFEPLLAATELERRDLYWFKQNPNFHGLWLAPLVAIAVTLWPLFRTLRRRNSL